MLDIRSMTCTGYFPVEVSAESITASAPSMIELATSLTSARVGVRLSIMVSIIWVAIITGIRASLALRTNSFWRSGTSCAGVSTAKSPRATMSPWQLAMISSILANASGFSILAMIGISSVVCALMSFLRSSISLAWRTKERAIQSTSCSMAKMASLISFSVRAGREMLVLGRFTPFLDLSTPPCSTLATTVSFSLVDTTSKISLPSSKSTLSPAFTSRGNWV